MKITAARSIDKMIEEQILRWQLLRRRERPVERLPVIAVSRQFGSGGDQVASELSEELKFDFFDKQIVQQVSENARLSEKWLATLDQKGRSTLEEWLASLHKDYRISSEEYIGHLGKVIRGICLHGGAVILGRGGSFLLSDGQALRVLITASLKARIKRTASKEGISEKEARSMVIEADADRRAFVMKYYRSEFLDVQNYDLVINTDILGISGALNCVKGALEVFKTRRVKR